MIQHNLTARKKTQYAHCNPVFSLNKYKFLVRVYVIPLIRETWVRIMYKFMLDCGVYYDLRAIRHIIVAAIWHIHRWMLVWLDWAESMRGCCANNVYRFRDLLAVYFNFFNVFLVYASFYIYEGCGVDAASCCYCSALRVRESLEKFQ